MRREELQAAVRPVKSYFHGQELNSNTVLAAWMRSVGLAPNGSEWQLAKSAVQAGLGFEEAVDLALGRGSRAKELGPRSIVVAPAPKTEPRRDAAPRRAMPRTVEPVELHNGLPVLQQFSKQRTSGDLDGDGARKLLGAFALDPVSVLVRETAQNSWDARRRSGSSPLELTYHLWQVSEDQARLLRENLLVGRRGLARLNEALRRRPWLLEISDRGTKGLGGPTRNDKPSRPGDPTDYMDLVLNLGAPRDVAKGGGTYGFGKTITYTISKAETVAIWTFTEHDREHRLIGSAMSRSFDEHDTVFTGRHWWGLEVPDADRVEPVTGAPAADLGSRLFSRGFEPEETGTSILIVAPDFGERTPEQFVDALGKAVLRELWPKLVPHGDVQPMQVKVLYQGEDRTPAPPKDHEVLRHYARCLDLIRERDAGRDPRPPIGTELIQIRGGHGDHLIGHLAIAHLMYAPEAAGEHEPPTQRIALMRNEAELIVNYHRVPGTGGGDEQWVGVFKPIGDATVDNDFANAEPPTHDAWIVPSSVRGHSRVRIAFRRMKEHMDRLLKPKPDPVAARDLSTPTAALAQALSGLMTVGSESAPQTRTGGGARKGPRKARARIIDRRIQSADGDSVQWVVTVTLEGPPAKRSRVEALATLASDGDGRPDVDPAACRVVGWRDPASDASWEHGAGTSMVSGATRELLVEGKPRFAVSLRFQVDTQ